MEQRRQQISVQFVRIIEDTYRMFDAVRSTADRYTHRFAQCARQHEIVILFESIRIRQVNERQETGGTEKNKSDSPEQRRRKQRIVEDYLQMQILVFECQSSASRCSRYN